MTAPKGRRQLRGFVAIPHAHPQTARLGGLLTEIAHERRDPTVELVFAHERLITHAVLVRKLRRLVAASDFVVCFTDGTNLNVSFEAGLAVGLGKPLVLAILPGTRRMPATFVGQFYVELAGDAEDPDQLRVILASVVAGRSRRLSRFGCAGGSVTPCIKLE